MSKVKTLTGTGSCTSRISALDTGRGREGKGRSRRGRGCGRRGRGRGHLGRGSIHNPNFFIPPHSGSFQPEARVYRVGGFGFISEATGHGHES